VVEGVIEKAVKGGYDVNLGAGVRAFLPISQSDAQKIDKPEKLLDLKAKILCGAALFRRQGKRRGESS